MKVLVKKLNEKAVVPYKKHERDFCYDVTAVSVEEVAPNVYRYGTGLAFEIVGDDRFKPYVTFSIDFRPRSSVWKTGMVLANCTGTIDEGYRGEVCAVYYHVMPDMPKYEVGDRIGQIKIGATDPLEFEVVEELTDTSRGDGGFGSTGK